ncbi:ATP-binding cassette, subfamily F, member 3 [Nitrosomonas marina]|uniref:Probable ATP-binding protein YheS n=1 Tax=Nitrosomonas marina TaxID=917 RepID=A0A1H9Y7M6_9PROT|nr:ATP-binding cassette domain-containing protein [Nitrosomonas marina]SES64916.1 ATP-binding cassette, subfamily F, member 3 [Nitrosomonas marina]
MLTIQSLTFLQGGIPLLQDCYLQIFAGQRVGLVGCNGSGKSTLFRLIRGAIKPDAGEINLQAGKTIAFVEQEIIDSEQPALEFVLDGDAELRQLEDILGKARHDSAWFEAQQQFEAIDGYGAQARAAQLLDGLGFTSDVLRQPVNRFSGGWRMRLNLARALMHRADLLLLDEPTNHLDLEAILWLEQYLLRYSGSLIVVSHDREFLNTCVNRIAHIHHRRIDSYTGNYDDFERARAERLQQQAQAYQQQQKQIAHMEDFVRRFRAKATKAKQAQSRIKALERLTRIAPVHMENGHFELQIDAPERSPDVLLRANQMSFGYTENKPLFENVRLILQAGARIALLGPNGAGKSTLIKLLTKDISPGSGTVEWAPNLRIGYFAQHQLDLLDAGATPLQHLARLAPAHTELELRTFLGRFGMGGNTEDRVVGTFSGGEKSRLALALLAWKKPHMLLLDEPTNHLDLDMRDALTLALEAYSGAVVLVSHDRSLVRAIADELWLVADGRVRLFDGDLDDYKQWVGARRDEMVQSRPAADKTRQKSPARPNKKSLLARQSKLEAAIDTAQKALAETRRQLADPAIYSQRTRTEIDQLSVAHDALEQKIADLEESWLELEMALEE